MFQAIKEMFCIGYHPAHFFVRHVLRLFGKAIRQSLEIRVPCRERHAFLAEVHTEHIWHIGQGYLAVWRFVVFGARQLYGFASASRLFCYLHICFQYFNFVTDKSLENFYAGE